MDISDAELSEIGRGLFTSSLLESVTEDSPEFITLRCAAAGIMHIDYEFHASLRSLIKHPETSPKTRTWHKFVWRRASEFLDPANIAIFCEGVHPDDIRQGGLGDCYFLSALSCLAETPKRIQGLFHTQAANAEGVYGIHMCQNGLWRIITVDDFFPCAGENAPPAFSKAIGDELWVMLLEKAYAKVHGSYERIERGSIQTALRDLTGAPSEVLSVANADLWDRLVGATGNNFIVAASAGDTKASQLLLEEIGLVGNNSYSISKALEVTADTGNTRIVKLRNPWGTLEWRGDWSRSSAKWTVKLKKQVQLSETDDGTFWMSFEDFTDRFTSVVINRVNDNHKYSAVRGNHSKGSHEVLRVHVLKRGIYVVSVNQRELNTMPEKQCYEYSPGLLVLAKELSENRLEYILGKRTLAKTARNFWEEVELQPGYYQVYVEMSWKSKLHSFVLSTYGPAETEITQLFQVPDFLQEIYCSAALQLETKTTYEREGVPNCTRYHSVMPEGYGFFYYVNKNRDTTLKEDCFFKKFKNLALLPPYSGTKFSVVVPPGEDSIVLFKQVGDKPFALLFNCTAAPAADSTALIEEAKRLGTTGKRADPRSGKDLEILVYTYRHDLGICFFYENKTPNKTIDETVTFTMEGLAPVGFKGNSCTVVLGPGQSKLVELQSVRDPWSIQTSVSYSIS